MAEKATQEASALTEKEKAEADEAERDLLEFVKEQNMVVEETETAAVVKEDVDMDFVGGLDAAFDSDYGQET